MVLHICNVHQVWAWQTSPSGKKWATYQGECWLYHYMTVVPLHAIPWPRCQLGGGPLLASSSCFRKLTGSSLIYSSWKCGSDLQFCVYRNMCYLFCPQYNYIFCVGEEKVYVQGPISWLCLPHIFCSRKNIPSLWAQGTSLVEIRSGMFVYI